MHDEKTGIDRGGTRVARSWYKSEAAPGTSAEGFARVKTSLVNVDFEDLGSLMLAFFFRKNSDLTTHQSISKVVLKNLLWRCPDKAVGREVNAQAR